MLLNLKLMKSPANWIFIPFIAFVGLLFISLLFAPVRRAKAGATPDASGQVPSPSPQ